MDKNFEKVQNYLLDLEYTIATADEESGIFVINKEDEGIKNMILAIAEPILIMEQPLFALKDNNADVLKELLAKNREIVHGAFALDNNGVVIFRDTLQLENLDLNELEGSINSLSILLSEYGSRIVEISK